MGERIRDYYDTNSEAVKRIDNRYDHWWKKRERLLFPNSIIIMRSLLSCH